MKNTTRIIKLIQKWNRIKNLFDVKYIEKVNFYRPVYNKLIQTLLRYTSVKYIKYKLPEICQKLAYWFCGF